MAKYSAHVEDTTYPLGFSKWIEGKRIDAINRAVLKTGKAWHGLELPKAIKRGHYFTAYYDGMRISIWKD